MSHGRALLLVFLLLMLAVPARAQDVGVRVEAARDGDRRLLVVELTIPPGYHAYAHQAGDAGRPTTLRLSVNGGKPLPVWYPDGAMQRDIYDPDATVFVYEDTVRLYAELPDASGDGSGEAAQPGVGVPSGAAMPLPGDSVSLSGDSVPLPGGAAQAPQDGGPAAEKLSYTLNVSLLLCSSRHCLPVDQELRGELPAQPWPEAARQLWYGHWRELSRRQPVGADAAYEGGPRFSATGGGDSMAQSVEAFLGRGRQESALPAPAEFDFALEPRYEAETFEISSFGMAVLVGLLAGLLLNAMPCVLPVLTFKVSGLLLMGGAADKEGLRRFREHNLLFSAGVLTLFTALGLLFGAADMMWGQLYQHESILLVLLVLVFLMGLSMLGVFTLPVIDLKAGTDSRNPRLQSYLTGLVSTFLATPCSGPMLGGVLGWAFTQSLIVLVVIFWSVGVGMALPYIIFSIWPQFARVLPRPGAWMKLFERFLGFCLLGTALYLLSILPVAKHMQVLMVLLLVSLGAWLWGQFCGPTAPTLRRRLVGTLCLGILVAALVWVLRPVSPLPHWKDFSSKDFVAELGAKPLLLEFTADYCPNCKFLEATVLTDERLRSLRARYGMELVRVDLTNPDAFAMRLLDALGSRSIPLTALFPAGEGARSPVVLRDVYTANQLEDAAERAFSGS
ncbi:cytochrome c biogenesis protein CcdA [uncultured Desulfovibrio sp.]|uniref:protein-disulfide reductase DsbD family protein n=1 Tax=uncultured Desulfovibrio sp. TaxID=167968 RepID=UPI00261F0961|nr:cytochrome c biogenesis protein CcdA [uncultured Desulfovibrio sp.]